jgi:hypothetical protein
VRLAPLVFAVTLLGSLVLAFVLAPVARADAQAPLTHTTPLTPTGDVLPRGHGQRVQSVTAFHHHLALGLGGGAELSLSTPFLPIPLAGGDLQLRISVLPPASRAALVLGAAATFEWFDGFDAWTAATATFAWREPRWSVHATLRAANHAAHDDRFGLATLGATRRVGRSTLLYAELIDLGWLHPSTCPDYHTTGTHPCLVRDAVQLLWVGAWWSARSMRVGVSAALLHVDDTLPALPILPLLSFAWDKDL